MPNGGLHHCGNCQHLNQQSSMCELRNIPIKNTHWTTCKDMNENRDVPHGPMYSIVCQVKNGAGSYCDIPWFQGHRVDTEQQTGGRDTVVVVTDLNGKRNEFPDVATYMEFWRRNTSKVEK